MRETSLRLPFAPSMAAILGSLALAIGPLDAVAAAEPARADVLLQGGTIVDGAGQPGVAGDVAIRGGTLVAVGKFDGEADSVIDCRGLIVAPGFIDLHNHSDGGIISPRTRANVNFLTQGCTTIVTGNCGSGPIDVRAYFAKIDAAGAGTNVIHLLPQGTLRREVIGEAQRKATPEELARMKQLAERAMRDGAWGMSTGLIYVPSSYADTDELVEIAKVVGAHGGIYASHIRGEGLELLASIDEALAIGRRAELPVHVSHFKASGREAWGLVRHAARMIEEARSKGQIVTADQYPYTASSTSLEATLIPTWARAGGQKALVARFDDAEVAPRLKEEIAKKLELRDDGAVIRIARYAPRGDWTGLHLAEIARKENKTPLALVEEITRRGGAAIVNFGMSEEDVRFAMQLPWVATASDGNAFLPDASRPHPRSYGTFSRKIGRYAIAEKVLPLEQAVRSASGLPADILGLVDRGYLREGWMADIVVFDPERFRDAATFESPHRYSEGCRHVFVAGQPAILDGRPTGALAGRALPRAKRERSAPE
ncbi:MAG: D-aminoacylase [Planctomycetales bacterium]